MCVKILFFSGSVISFSSRHVIKEVTFVCACIRSSCLSPVSLSGRVFFHPITIHCKGLLSLTSTLIFYCDVRLNIERLDGIFMCRYDKTTSFSESRAAPHQTGLRQKQLHVYNVSVSHYDWSGLPHSINNESQRYKQKL